MGEDKTSYTYPSGPVRQTYAQAQARKGGYLFAPVFLCGLIAAHIISPRTLPSKIYLDPHILRSTGLPSHPLDSLHLQNPSCRLCAGCVVGRRRILSGNRLPSDVATALDDLAAAGAKLAKREETEELYRNLIAIQERQRVGTGALVANEMEPPCRVVPHPGAVRQGGESALESRVSPGEGPELMPGPRYTLVESRPPAPADEQEERRAEAGRPDPIPPVRSRPGQPRRRRDQSGRIPGVEVAPADGPHRTEELHRRRPQSADSKRR